MWTSIIYTDTNKSLQSQKVNLSILVSNFALFICHKEVKNTWSTKSSFIGFNVEGRDGCLHERIPIKFEDG